MSTTFPLKPEARTLLHGIRAIGYDFATAVADIIDNSISAGAEHIDIYSHPYSPEDSYLIILDDGCGMGLDELKNALRLGSNRDDAVDDISQLGRFGLGLKSASFSQCKRLTVASKKTNRINALRYDLDQIIDENDWLINQLSDEEIAQIPEIDELRKYDSGTLVLWENFDRVEISSGDFEKTFRDLIDTTKKQVEITFFRFWDDIEFKFNGVRIEKRDPFLRNNPETQLSQPTRIPCGDYSVDIQPYAIPHANKLTNEDKKLLGDTLDLENNQGFYVFRNKRLIIKGNWLRVGIKRELNKLARIQIDIPSGLDEEWSLDVKKSTAKIPDKIKPDVESAISDVVKRSKVTNKNPGKLESAKNNTLWKIIKNPDGTRRIHLEKSNITIKTFRTTLTDEQKIVFDDILDSIEEMIPKYQILNVHFDNQTFENGNSDCETRRKKLVDNAKAISALKGWSRPEIISYIDEKLRDAESADLIDMRDEIIEEVMK